MAPVSTTMVALALLTLGTFGLCRQGCSSEVEVWVPVLCSCAKASCDRICAEDMAHGECSSHPSCGHLEGP